MSIESAESRLLIDGELTAAASGKTYDNLNPATEEVVGQVADAGPEDTERAIAAARRAFDETEWSTNPELRKRCLRQLQEALAKDRETLRPQIIAEVGAPKLAHLRGADGLLHRRHGVGHRGRRPGRSGRTTSRCTSSSGCAAPGGSCASRSVSSARSRRGTSRSCSTSRRSSPRSPPATRWCSRPRPTRRGARPTSASSRPSSPTCRPACSTSSRRATPPRPVRRSPPTSAST